MSNQQEKKQYEGVAVSFAVGTLFYLVLHWLLYTKLWYPPFEMVTQMILNRDKDIVYIRIFYVIMVFATCYIMPSWTINQDEVNDNKAWYAVAAAFFVIMIMIGYLKKVYWYNVFLYPILFPVQIYFTAKFTASLQPKIHEDIDPLAGINQQGINPDSLSLDTDKGTLIIPNPFQGIFVEGGAGAGKSYSIVNPIIKQCVRKGYAGVVYDYKGNPTTLGKTVYGAIEEAKKNGLPNIAKMDIINFSNLSISSRCNPIAPAYLNQILYANEYAEVVLKNLNKEWIKKTDFWAEGAMAGLAGIIWYLKKHHPEKCTLPHAVAIAVQPYQTWLTVLSEDAEVKVMLQPLKGALDRGADGQVAGNESSIQLPLIKLWNPEMFWVLAPEEDEACNLDISSLENRTFLTICNDPSLDSAISPCIGVILSTVMRNINQKGKAPCLFCIDELPTIYIKNLDKLPATARSNRVSTFLACQDFSQLRRDYGDRESDTIIANMGNQFVGMINYNPSADRIAKMLGKRQKKKYNLSNNSDGGQSISESLQWEDVMQASEIQIQSRGCFTGKIANGNPPFFSTKFAGFDEPNIDFEFTKIPVAILEKTQDSKEQIRLLEVLVQKNFLKINTDAAEILNIVDTIAQQSLNAINIS